MTLLKELREEIDAGIAMAADPDNAGLPDLARRVTTLHSRWYARTCRECRLKFREGDQVRLCPQCGEPYHDDPSYALRCWPKHFADGRVCTEGGRTRFGEVRRCGFVWEGELPDAPAETLPDAGGGQAALAPLTSHFVKGLEMFWRPYGEHKLHQVGTGSGLVGHKCPWCRFRIRSGDAVVACPCGCGTWFHQDVFRHMTCWNEWNGVEGNDYCPITGRAYGTR